jgi:hypothetical protein
MTHNWFRPFDLFIAFSNRFLDSSDLLEMLGLRDLKFLFEGLVLGFLLGCELLIRFDLGYLLLDFKFTLESLDRRVKLSVAAILCYQEIRVLFRQLLPEKSRGLTLRIQFRL